MNKFENAFVTKGELEYVIVKEVFIEEGNTGWTYERLKGGFTTEKEAKDYLAKNQ